MLKRNLHFTGWIMIKNREQRRSSLHGGLADLTCIALQRQREVVDALCKYAWGPKPKQMVVYTERWSTSLRGQYWCKNK